MQDCVLELAALVCSWKWARFMVSDAPAHTHLQSLALLLPLSTAATPAQDSEPRRSTFSSCNTYISGRMHISTHPRTLLVGLISVEATQACVWSAYVH